MGEYDCGKTVTEIILKLLQEVYILNKITQIFEKFSYHGRDATGILPTSLVPTFDKTDKLLKHMYIEMVFKSGILLWSPQSYSLQENSLLSHMIHCTLCPPRLTRNLECRHPHCRTSVPGLVFHQINQTCHVLNVSSHR